MKKISIVPVMLCLMAGCSKVEKKVLMERPFGDFRIIQYTPMGNATVDNYLTVAIAKKDGNGVKTILSIKGKIEPLEVDIKDQSHVEIHLQKVDVENMDFFDCGFSGGRVRLALKGHEGR